MPKEKYLSLPDYVVFDPISDHEVPIILRSIAKKLSFPLNAEDQEDVRVLTNKFDIENNTVGIASPQIGISKQIIIFSVLYTPELKKWRPDLTDTMPKTVWVNPTYKGLDEFGYSKDYEGCCSIKNYAGKIKRHRTIYYEAYTPTGQLTSGTASGYLARVLQHEIDHLNGILFTDRIKDKNQLITRDEYKRMREQGREKYQNPESGLE